MRAKGKESKTKHSQSKTIGKQEIFRVPGNSKAFLNMEMNEIARIGL